MIDVIQALELLEVCADEMSGEERHADAGPHGASARMSLAARALAKRQLRLAQLARPPVGHCRHDETTTAESPMSLGALIAFRTADRFGRAGATTEHALDAVYRAVLRYVEVVPVSLQDGADRLAVDALFGRAPSRVPGPERGDRPVPPTGAIGKRAGGL